MWMKAQKMNKLIEKELKNISVAILPEYDNNTTEIFISKGTRSADYLSFEKGRYYKIELNDILLNPEKESLILHVQWNNNIIPKDKFMNVEVLEKMGNMIKVSGTGVNSVNSWSGWLPIDCVKILNLL